MRNKTFKCSKLLLFVNVKANRFNMVENEEKNLLETRNFHKSSIINYFEESFTFFTLIFC